MQVAAGRRRREEWKGITDQTAEHVIHVERLGIFQEDVQRVEIEVDAVADLADVSIVAKRGT